VLTYLAALVLAVAPGSLLGWALPAGRSRWAVWAASPAVTLGLAAAAMGWLQRASLDSSPVAVLVGEVVTALALVLVIRVVTSRRSRKAGSTDTAASEAAGASRSGAGRPWPGDPLLRRLGLPRAAELVAVAIPSTVTVWFGHVFLGGIAQPPGWDAMNHAFFVRRMIDSGSTDIADVCVTGSTHLAPSCTFYPFSANVLWAQTVELTGGRVGTAMLGWGIVVAPVAMVLGMYAAVRVLGGRPVVASVAAFMPTLLGPMWMSLRSGRITEQAAPCMAAGVALLIALALRGRHPVRTGVVAAIATAGIVMSHTYDVLFIATVAIAMACLVPAARVRLRTLTTSLGTMLLTGLVALLPFVSPILSADAERTTGAPVYDTFAQSLTFWVYDFDRYVLFGFPVPGTDTTTLDVPAVQTALYVALVGFVASPIALFLRPLRWARPWIMAGYLWTLIGIWTAYSHNSFALALSGLWYGIRERVRNMILPVDGIAALAGACAIGLVLWWLVGIVVRRWRGSSSGAVHAATAAALVFVVMLTSFGVRESNWGPLRSDLAKRAPVGADYTRTFLWLRDHTPAGSVVAYDRHLEFMTWSYADYDTDLLFGVPPLTASSLPNYDRRWAAFNWLANTEGAKPAGCDVRDLDVEYLAFGKRRMPGWKADYSRARLASSPNVRLVHREGDLRIFAVTDAGRACGRAS
jgi:hypothetical protein